MALVEVRCLLDYPSKPYKPFRLSEFDTMPHVVPEYLNDAYFMASFETRCRQFGGFEYPIITEGL